jgi:hypothetical protein
MQWRMHHPKRVRVRVNEHERVVRDRFRQCVDVSVQLHHFVGVYEGMTHDGECLAAGGVC